MEATQVRRAARRVRVASEQIAPKLGFDRDLRNFCLIAAPAVVRALAEVQIRARLVVGHFMTRGKPTGHCWAEADSPEQWIVDVTASQFRLSWPRVVVLGAADARRAAYQPYRSGAAAVACLWRQRATVLRAWPKRWWVTPPGEDALARIDAALRVAKGELPASPSPVAEVA
jgi:hypothetical protein